MINSFSAVGLLAEAGESSGGILPELPLPMLLAVMGVLFYFLFLRPQQAKDKNFRSQLEKLKEKDRVVTIGGIHGVVTSVRRDRNEVILRVDESTGTKICFNITAIAKLVTDDDEKENDKKANGKKDNKEQKK